ncbi:MAG: restriction endonuclease, partial [Candidatus Methylomirabilales bacterium]
FLINVSRRIGPWPPLSGLRAPRRIAEFPDALLRIEAYILRHYWDSSLLLRFVVPLFIPAGSVTSSTFALKAILGIGSVAAPFIALVLLLPAPLAAFRQYRKRRLLDKQKDLGSIRSLSWRRFETLVGEAYRRQGYAVSGNASDCPDGGVDLVLKRDGSTLLVQCKQWKAWKVGVKVVREILGVMTDRHADGAIIVTSGLFTQEARSFAAGKPIELIEGQQLAELVLSVQDGPAATAPHAGTASRKICPKCGADMVLRTAQRGTHTGQQFWGCSRFPACKQIEQT